MEQKTKFIIIGLIGVAVIFIFLFVQTLNSKNLLIRERDDLKTENTSLSDKIAKLEQGLHDYEKKVGLLNDELDKVSRQRDDLNKKYDLVNKEKEQLIAKLKETSARVASVASQLQSQAKQTTPEIMTQSSDAYWAGILKVKTDLELQLAKVRNDLKAIQISNEELQRENSALQLDKNSLEHDKEDLKRQLDYNQKLSDSIAQELVRERNDKAKILDSFKTLKSENNMLTRQLRGLNERKIDLEKRLQKLQETKDAIEAKFTELETLLTDKVTKIDNLKEQMEAIRGSTTGSTEEQPKVKVLGPGKESVELPPIVVRPQPDVFAEDVFTSGEGKVLAINRDSNFVIIDLGENAGIKAGDNFQVYSNGNPIATIEVVQTRKDIAACDIKTESAPIKIGDAVK